MIRLRSHAPIALLLVLILLLTFAGCNKNAQTSEPEESHPPEISESSAPSQAPGTPSFVNPLPVPGGPSERPARQLYSEKAKEKHALNTDTIGWIAVPNTSLDDVVVWYPGDENMFYLQKDFDKRYSLGGTYYADFRSKWEGGRAGIPTNTIVYGHSMEDSPDGPLFSQLKKFLDEDFARKNPYIFFSTVDDDMVFEVFAVFYTDVYLLYNVPYPDTASYTDLLQSVSESTIYNYDVEVTANDKIITLSTCCYNITPTYPNNYRYVIMGRLVDKNAELKDEASITKNPAPKMPK